MSNFNRKNVKNEKRRKGKSMSDVVDAPLIALNRHYKPLKIVESSEASVHVPKLIEELIWTTPRVSTTPMELRQQQ
jgi:hypothetical protein